MSVAMQRELFAPARSVIPRAQPLPLHPHQEQALAAIAEARVRGVTRQLVSIPTGGGKTRIAVEMIARREFPAAVFLVHRDELVRQTVHAISQADPSLTIGVVKAERNECFAEVVIGSVQTLAHAKRRDQLAAVLPRPLLVIADEAHHFSARTYVDVVQTLAPELLIGLTATAYRADGLALGQVFDEIVFHYPMIPLIAAGKLANLVGLRIDTEADLDAVHSRGGELVESELAHEVDTPSRNELVVRSWREHAWGQGRRRTVAFCVNVAHAEHLRDTFRADGVECEMVLGVTPTDERERIYERFHLGSLPVLVNVMVCTEGWDEPAADCGLMTRPTQSLGLYVQMVGRLARAHGGKKDSLIIDYVDLSSRHQLVTLPTLAGREAHEAAGDADRDEPPAPDGRADRASQGLLEMVEETLRVRKKRAVAVDLFGASPYAWSEINGQWMTTTGNGYLTLIADGDGFMPVEIQTPRGQAAQVKRLFDRALDLETARSVAEALVPKNALTDREAGWRKGAPSEAQLQLASRRRIEVTKGMTKGELSDLIDRQIFSQTMTKLQKGQLI